jgi:hypothetical protein
MNNDEALKGYRFKIALDPTDPRFEVLTVRYVSNAVVGGPQTPLVDLEGAAAYRRWCRFLLARAMGFLSNDMSKNALDIIRRVHSRYEDP